MRFGEIKCCEISSQYQLKNTSYFNRNDLMVKAYIVTSLDLNPQTKTSNNGGHS